MQKVVGSFCLPALISTVCIVTLYKLMMMMMINADSAEPCRRIENWPCMLWLCTMPKLSCTDYSLSSFVTAELIGLSFIGDLSHYRPP